MLSNYFANEYTFEFPFEQFVEEEDWFIKKCDCKIKKERGEFVIKIKKEQQYLSLSKEDLKMLEDVPYYLRNRIIIPREKEYKINKIYLPEFIVIPQYNGIKFHYKIKCESLLEDEKRSYIILDSKSLFYLQLAKKYSEVHIYILIILGKYFRRLCGYRTKHLEENIITGWRNSTYRRIFLNASSEEDEEGNQRMYMFKLKEETYDSLTEKAVGNILQILEKSTELTFIFAYGLLAVTINAEKEYPERNKEIQSLWKGTATFREVVPFQLCICGTNRYGILKKDIAVIFLDYAKKMSDSFQRSYNQIPHLPLKRINNNIDRICLYKDCPIIMYPSSNAATISSSAAVLNKIKRLIAQGIIKGFPVLISEKRVMDDYILNIDISDITLFTDGKRKKLKDLPDGKSKLSDEDLSVQVESIVYHYINYIEDLLFCDSETTSEKLEAKRHFYRDPFDNYSEIFSDERYNLPLAKMYRDLLTALDGFSYYIKKKYSNFRDIMDEILEQAICVAEEDALDCEIKEIQKVSGKSPVKRINKKEITEEFFTIVLKILEDENVYHTQDNEFLLIDYKMFQRYYRGANHKTFLSNCKKIGIIEIPIRKKTGEPRGYAFDKMKDGKKYKVLKIKKAAFEKYKKETEQ